MALSLVGPVVGHVQKVGLQLLLEPTVSAPICRGACNVTGIVYPVYASFKAIESEKDKEDDQQWLTYWAIYGTLLLGENFMDDALSKVPYYYHLKLAFLLWLQLPYTQGAKVGYKKYLRPTLKKYEGKVDVIVQYWKVALAQVIDSAPAQAVKEQLQYVYLHAETFMKWFFASGPGAKGDEDA